MIAAGIANSQWSAIVGILSETSAIAETGRNASKKKPNVWLRFLFTKLESHSKPTVRYGSEAVSTESRLEAAPTVRRESA